MALLSRVRDERPCAPFLNLLYLYQRTFRSKVLQTLKRLLYLVRWYMSVHVVTRSLHMTVRCTCTLRSHSHGLSGSMPCSRSLSSFAFLTLVAEEVVVVVVVEVVWREGGG